MGIERQAFGNETSAAANTPEDFGFIAESSVGSRITAVTIVNATFSERSYKAYVVDNLESPVNPIVPARAVSPGETDNPPELIGQVIPPGGTVQFESNFSDTLAFTVSVRDLE